MSYNNKILLRQILGGPISYLLTFYLENIRFRGPTVDLSEHYNLLFIWNEGLSIFLIYELISEMFYCNLKVFIKDLYFAQLICIKV